MEASASEEHWERPPLAGYRVGVVAHRGRQEQAEVLLRVGAEPVLGPVVSGAAVTSAEALEAATEEVVDDPPAVVIFTSAVGVEGWLSSAEEMGRDRSLRGTLATSRVLVQGTTTGEAATALEVTINGVLTSEVDESDRPLAASGGDVADRRVAVQFDTGGPPPPLLERLRRAGAVVLEVVTPIAALPTDPEPALRLLEDLAEGRVEALTFTGPIEVRNFVSLAEQFGLHDKVMEVLNDEVTVVCISRACECVAMAVGLVNVVRPQRARVGAMVDVLVGHLQERTLHFELGNVEVALRGALAVIDGEDVWLTDGERALLAALARRPGVVVTKAELLRRVWRSDGVDGVDGHAVEVAVGRLRRRLGPAGAALQTVPRRGYRLAGG
jgi:uroporphyrinogen-III synthase